MPGFTRRKFAPIAAASALANAATQPPLQFAYWDVFSSQRFTGNPLAIFTGAEHLSKDQMQAIARETNLSETTFILRRPAAVEAKEGVRVRIFTPVTEYDFAGHPTLGTAMSLWKQGMKKIVLHLNVGPVPVEFLQKQGQLFGEMTQPKPVFGETHDVDVIARLIGVRREDMDATHPIQNVSTGRPNLIVMLRSLAALRALQPNWPAVADYFKGGDTARGFYFLTRETLSSEARFHARKLTPRTEDPVTGSAAGSAIAWLVEHGVVKEDEAIVIEQGHGVNRPGQLFVRANRGGVVKVGGYAVKVWTGSLNL
jgi:trans-2,3-dihydro-3-hydroxyanthranilate isomerase